MFCGGRGSTTITRELLRWPNVQLNLLVNAYDDGLSTGELRDFIPGMLGPSDFRKNLSHLLDLYSNQQHALQLVLEYRLPLDFTDADRAALEAYVADPRSARSLTPELRELFSQLDRDLRDKLLSYLNRFFFTTARAGRSSDSRIARSETCCSREPICTMDAASMPPRKILPSSLVRRPA